MGTTALIVLLIICIIAVLYCIFILFVSYGFFMTKTEILSEKNDSVSVSIIVAFKNEQQNIVECLKCLFKQSYNKNNTEIILVDDYSTDNSFLFAENEIRNYNADNIKLVSLKNMNISGSKKNAVETAVNIASGKLIILTDADCRMSEKWVETIVGFYIRKKPKLILGPVRYNYKNSFFQRIQSLEFLSYIAAACGTAYLKKPILCNGANMAYERDLFINLDPYNDNKNYNSGDDIFLLQKLKKVWGGSNISFLKNSCAIVDTFPEESIKGFIKQRVRWASKSKGYKDIFTILSAYLIFIYSFFILLLLPFAIFYSELRFAFLLFYLIKIIIDFPSYLMITGFTSQRKLLWYYLPLQILYPLYIVYVGIKSTLKKR